MSNLGLKMGVSLARVHRDLLGLVGVAPGQHELQDALLVLGAHLVRVQAEREGEGADEGAGAAFLAEGRAVFASRLGLAFAADRDRVVLDGDLEFLGIDAGQLCGKQGIVLTRPDVHGRELSGGGRPAASEGFEQLVHLPVQSVQFAPEISAMSCWPCPKHVDLPPFDVRLVLPV
jgi:hypothetical protein